MLGIGGSELEEGEASGLADGDTKRLGEGLDNSNRLGIGCSELEKGLIEDDSR